MLAPGSYARRGLRHVLAVDLGTAHTRMWSPALGRVIDEPTLVAWGPPGSRRAVGRAALTEPGARPPEDASGARREH